MTGEVSAGLKALNYAERQLGANSVYEDAQEARKKLEEALFELNSMRADKRMKEAFRLDREMELIEEERRNNPQESQAAFERRFKVVLSNDGDIRGVRDELTFLAGQIDDQERVVKLLSEDIQIAVARMQELGGYFQYLAAVKQASASLQVQPKPDGNPW